MSHLEINRKIKIVQIASSSKGGIGRITVDLYNTMLKENIDCYIAYARGKISNNISSIKIGSQIDVLFHALMSRFTDRSGFYSKRATIKFIKKLEKINPDIIHIHNLHGYYINVHTLFEFIKRKNIKVVWTLHDCWAFTGHCAYFDAAGCSKWRTGCDKCIQKKTYPKSNFIDNSKRNFLEKKYLYENIDNLYIVTPSNWLKEIVKSSFLKKHDINVINNGIDLNTFKCKPSKYKSFNGIEEKIILLGVASTWSKRKGLDDFIKLSKKVDDRYNIVVVGVSEEQKKTLPSNITGISHTENVEELVDLYNAADLFLNLTYEDNFPTTNLEALACGTPVLTYQTGGSTEAIDSKCGFSVKQGDLDSILEILNHGYTKEKYTLACVEKAKKYDKYIKFYDYVKLYNQVMSK